MRKAITKKPEIKLATPPAIKNSHSEDVSLVRLSSEKITAPKIAGIDNKNEYRAASFLLIFTNRDTEMVVPEREIPGSKAKLCPTPISIDLKTPISLLRILFFLMKSEIKIIKPVSNNIIAAIRGLWKFFSIKSSAGKYRIKVTKVLIIKKKSNLIELLFSESFLS